MSDITKIDKNFAKHSVVYEGMKVYHITEPPFTIYGLYQPKPGDFRRMPQELAQSISRGVDFVHTNTSGGRIRFKTDSSRITLRSIMPNLCKFPHMPTTGTSCFDLYVDGAYCGPFNFGDGVQEETCVVCEATLNAPNHGMHEVLIHFPLYNDVTDVYIALDENAKIEKTDGYADETPVVFYGSSITQGGCASHAGNAYPAILSRKMDFNYINLGFSGACHGETAMAEYIASLPMRAFVLDYDHNAGSVDQLLQTHSAIYACVRKHHPKLPILMITTADLHFGDTIEARKQAIKETYRKAKQNGDERVWFLDGQTIYRTVGLDHCTVDTVHPNDLGFWCMAQEIGKKLQEMLTVCEKNSK